MGLKDNSFSDGISESHFENLLSKAREQNRKKGFQPYVPLSKYNIFNILNITDKEVAMCRFLTDLLNPEGAHGCGILFLKSFLQNVLNINHLNDLLLTHTHVINEFILDNDRRIDIVIQNSRVFIPIEVKIYASDQAGQCYDYYEYAKSHDENTQLVYLTRFGSEPSEYSRKAKNGAGILPPVKIKCISWENHICKWLTALLPQLKEPAKWMVMQYIDAIHLIADRREYRIMEKNLELLYESADYFTAGIQIEKTMKTAKLKLIRLVFDDFKTAMDMIASEYGLELEKDTNYYSYEESRHEKFYDCYSTYPGLNYVVKNAKFKKSSLQMWFRIEIEHNLFAGISLFDTDAAPKDGYLKGYQVNDISREIIDEAAQYLNKDIITPEDWWFTWCYSNGKRHCDNDNDIPNFKEMNPYAVSLVNGQTRKIYVESAVKNFEEHILKYLQLNKF